MSKRAKAHALEIVAVVFSDGSTAPVSEAALRRYLKSGDEKEILRMNFGAFRLKMWLRGLHRNWRRFENLEKARSTHDADRARTLRNLRDAERRLINIGTPAHKVRKLAADEAHVSRARADQLLGQVKKTKLRK